MPERIGIGGEPVLNRYIGATSLGSERSGVCPSVKCSCGRDQGYCEECNCYHHRDTWEIDHEEMQNEIQIQLLLGINPMFKHDRDTFAGSLGLTDERRSEITVFIDKIARKELLFSQKIEVTMKKYKGHNGELGFALISLGRMYQKYLQSISNEKAEEGEIQ
jgi:hypothetical protein